MHIHSPPTKLMIYLFFFFAIHRIASYLNRFQNKNGLSHKNRAPNIISLTRLHERSGYENKKDTFKFID